MTVEIIAAGLLAILAALFGAVRMGRKSAANEAAKEELEAYADTRKRMDQIGRLSDADAAREWLHDRAKRGRDL